MINYNFVTPAFVQRSEASSEVAEVPSTPKKLLGSLLEGKSEVSKLEEEVMSSRLKEVEAMAELKDLRLKVMDLETQTHVYHNQLKRQGEDSTKLSDDLEECKKREAELQTQLRSVWLAEFTLLCSLNHSSVLPRPTSCGIKGEVSTDLKLFNSVLYN